ncbi:beta-glucosidase [Candidatus Falkowbacteria bacterium CG11_big_fil_rev_8_21_14_0_20_39_10]|uniref:Beta-glucosidase n=1 Tax=Candidatus Falkowbacteria bacterium CG11_big_fil_rev_8_21_14_0_20_39_10 TaxID=1974570 RepID=A0A2M6K9U9_9BACT|nr:MAG: beta-glucosidase [Candidatus Falkowbacteria bacterium CG11_big_fil_rev_8_21_14_0_20_39_10]
MQKEKILKFPNDFIWGASTSAHQIEGGNYNDWSVWEKANAKKLARKARKKYQPWQLEKFPEMLEPETYISGAACDSWNRFDQDLACLKELGIKAYRFSVEWSRIEPEEGKFNLEAIARYKDWTKLLRQNNIEPFVALWHYTLPVWFCQKGGWLHPDAEKLFLRFTEKIVGALKEEASYWLTFNEPETVVRNGYLAANRPPQKRSPLKAFKAIKKLVKIHKSAYQLIHKIGGKNMRVSFAESLVCFESYSRWPHNLLLKRLFAWWRNDQFVPKVVKHCDFIGLQYYFHSRIRLNPFVSWKWFQYNENKFGLTDMNWEIYPPGIYHVLKDLKKYNKPIIITENGLADADDSRREKFIKEHLRYVHQAIDEGADVRGYFHWSLLDNFEWAEGWWAKFGLYSVDRRTFKRTAKPSAKVYARICKENIIKL